MKIKKLYILVMFGCSLLPFAGMLTGQKSSSSENRTLAEFPTLRDEDGSWNLNWLSDAGDWFQDHFAFRNELVTANALLESRVFGDSADDSVVVGTEGWLYYADTVANYQGESSLSDRELYNIAHSLALMQEYAENQGISFLFAPVPNKNTLYGEHMPYYYPEGDPQERVILRLYSFLEEEGVSYLNLMNRFEETEEVLYHRTDSHWTNQGAALAAEAVCGLLEQDSPAWSMLPGELRCDFTGDLAKMLYPSAAGTEEEFYYDWEFAYSYVNEISSTFDPKIYTENPNQEGSLVVYRDSFGNAWLPFFSGSLGEELFFPHRAVSIDDGSGSLWSRHAGDRAGRTLFLQHGGKCGGNGGTGAHNLAR